MDKDSEQFIIQAILYEIQVDQSPEYKTDKIVFNHHNLKMLKTYCGEEVIKVIGLYGTLESVSIELQNIIGNHFQFNEQIKVQQRAFLCGIQKQNLLLICGIFPEEYFSTKPINEKSIEITLFRILQDLTQNIILCPSKKILKNWYEGDEIPYKQIERNVRQYQIQANKTQEKIQESTVTLTSLLNQGIGWNYVSCLNQSNISARYKIELSDQPLDEKLIKKLIIDFILKAIHDQHFRAENYIYQFSKAQQTIISILFGPIQLLILEEIKKNNKKLYDRMFSFYHQGTLTFKETAICKAQDYVNYITNNLYFSINMNIFTISQEILNQEGNKKLQNYLHEYFETTNKLYQIQSETLIEQIKYKIKEQDLGFKVIIELLQYQMIRKTDNSLEQVTLSTIYSIQMEDLKIDNQNQLRVINLFDMENPQRRILILENRLMENEIINTQYLIYLVIQNRISKQIIKLNKIEKPCFYWSKTDRQLFSFNYNKEDVASITISNQGFVISEKIHQINNYINSNNSNHNTNQMIRIKCALYSKLAQNFFLLDYEGVMYKWGFQEKFYPLILPEPSYQIDSERYNSLQGEEKSQFVFLSTKNVVDIYDQNFKKLHSIKLNKSEIKVFQDNFDIFIVQLKDYSVIVLENLSSQLILKNKNTDKQNTKLVGNPYFDIIQGSQLCFGVTKQQLFLSAELKNSDKLQLLTDYFENKLELDKVNIMDTQVSSQQYMQYSNKKLNLLFYQQVPVQICTIENNQIVPLIDGFKEQNLYEIKIQSLVQMSKKIFFGQFESLIKDFAKESVFVVGIVGMQSSGKSYLLNRLFGTKFSVSASRCTDGIWMNFCQIQNQYFIVLDCEGLFSPRRNEKEESQLLALLSAVSDITILNQTLSTNRNLNRLFEDLTESIGKLKGDSLFKGQLFIVTRDVSKDTKEAEDELKRNILELRNKTIDKSFLQQLFNDQFSTSQLSNYENKSFEKEIDKLRKVIPTLCGNRNITFGNLVEKIKILLVQLQMADNENVDKLYYQLKVDDLFHKSIDLWENFEDQQSILEFENFQWNQIDIKLQNNLQQNNFQILLNFIRSKITLKVGIDEHNTNIDKLNQILTKVLSHRRECIVKNLKKEYDSFNNNYISKDILNCKLLELDKQLTTLQNQYQICGQQCEQCYLKCQKPIQHQQQVPPEGKQNLQWNDDHDCLRESHLCDYKCQICKEVPVNCNLKSGHLNEHLCQKQDHQCDIKCEIGECKNNCTKPFKHQDKHSCRNAHQCKQICQYCEKFCQTDLATSHIEHNCKSNHCSHLCFLCQENGRFCTESHSHTLVKEKNKHFCEKKHMCKSKCEQKGICSIKYEPVQMKWVTKLSEFTYPYYKQIDQGKEGCNILIETKMENHIEIQHSCKNKKHYCSSRCPECQSFCSKKYGHEGNHFSEQHRNKEQQYFTSTESHQSFEIEDKLNNSVKKYSILESSKPETCTESCRRRGRAHFHLLACPGKEKCYQNRIKGARHQSKPYAGFENQEFDEILCFDFWELHKWNNPVQNQSDLDIIQQCNCYCPECGQNHFCIDKAWHTQSLLYKDHKFQCTESHKAKFSGLDLVFVIDATLSMQSYIDMVKERIKNIMDKAKSKVQSVRCAIVAYRDHPPEEKEFITKIHNFSGLDEAQTFLNNLKADGGGDYPEAVLDGLWEGVTLQWEKKNQKLMFLIGDAPPHGTLYHNEPERWPKGCCNIRDTQIFNIIDGLQIELKILALKIGLNQMIQRFQTLSQNIEVIEGEDDLEFGNKMEDKIVGKINQLEITAFKNILEKDQKESKRFQTQKV